MARKIGIILFLFVGFYMAGHYWIRWRNTITDDVTKLSRLVECEANQVRALSIDTPPESLEFQRVDSSAEGTPAPLQLMNSEWNMTAPIKGEADAAMMASLAAMVCETYDPISLRDSEWTANSGTTRGISFTVSEGPSKGAHILEFGSITADRMVMIRYTSPAGTVRVVKVPSKIFQQASLKPRQYLNMRVMRMSSDNINRVSVSQKGKELFSLERAGSGWTVNSGGKLLGPGSEEADKYVNRLATLRAIKVESEDLSPANCDPASSRITAKVSGVGDKSETIFFQYGKVGAVTACNTAREALFTLHRDFVKYLETPAEKLLAGKN
jgi:hypothetical protein